MWDRCADATKVAEVVIVGGVHTWPVNDPAHASRGPDYRYSASAALWRFLAPMRRSPSTVDARLLSLSVSGTGGHRRLRATFRAGEQLTVKATLHHRGGLWPAR